MKIRLYAQPPGRASMLVEVDLPEEDGTDAVPLKSFSPPPDNQADIARFGAPRVWAVTLDAPNLEELSRLCEEVRVVPFGDAKPRGGGWPVELALSSGQAEARLNWWMQAPTEWTATQALVTLLMELSLRERSADLDPEDAYVDDRGQGGDVDDQVDFGSAASPRPGRRKKGLLGKLLGG